MKTKFTMMMAVIATFAISLNLHSSNECISEYGKCGNGVEIGRPGEGSGEDGNHGAPTN